MVDTDPVFPDEETQSDAYLEAVENQTIAFDLAGSPLSDSYFATVHKGDFRLGYFGRSESEAYAGPRTLVLVPVVVHDLGTGKPAPLYEMIVEVPHNQIGTAGSGSPIGEVRVTCTLTKPSQTNRCS